ncbi:hypothetical protein BBJ28_00009440 [Nothophytophthora sp. Chile5]|nr:hypothetical protein BBJ28_00009440 [Nothophytophthora sp. Chile5]
MTADQCKKPLEELKKGPIPDTALPSVDAAILAAKAALIIQRVWKKRLRCRVRRSDRVEPPEFVEVSIVIDKLEEVRVVAPLFWAAPKAPCNPAVAQLQRETGPLLVEDESEAVPSLQWAEEEALTTDTKYPNAVEAQELPRSSWIDEEFIFLEEGRRGPELVDVVRRGVFMEEDELVNRQNLQATTSFASCRRVLVGTVQLEQQQDEEQRGQEMGSTVDEPRSGGAGGEGAATNIEISVDFDQFGAHHGSEPSGSAVPASGKGDRDEQPKSLAQGAVTTQDGFDRFVVFSGSWFPSNAHVADSNAPNPRNDLIYVGDLAVAGDLLRTGHLHQQREQARGIREDFILLPGGNPMVAMLGADPFVQENDARRDELDPRSLAESWLSGREAGSDRTGDEDAIGDGDSTEETKTQPIVSTSLCSEMESLPESFADGEAIRSLSESGGEVREGLRVDEGGETLLLHGSGTKADPFSALEVLESGASETLTRIHVQYSEEVALEDRSSASCGQSEAQSLMQLAPANATAVISTSRPRLDMDKRLEFLRVLDEFKRCLRPSSASPSSSSSTEDTPPSLSRSSASSKVQHADLGSEAEDEEAMDDTLQKARQNDQAAHIL